MIQLIEKHGNNWHMIINDTPVVLTKKLDMYAIGLFPLRANTDSGLRWRINRKWVSYKQIKKAIIHERKSI